MSEEKNTNEIYYRLANADDIPKCLEIESASYPEDEAATLSSLTYRQEQANPFFLLSCRKTMSDEEEILGFICATQCHDFAHETMSTHDPTGHLLAIHSVVISEPNRRKGYATKMMTEYIIWLNIFNQANEECEIEHVVLLAKHHLLGFYIHCGFKVEGESDIVHGKDTWYDLRMTLPAPIVHSQPPIRPSRNDTEGRKYFIVDSFAIPQSSTTSDENETKEYNYGGTGNPAAVVLMHEQESVATTNVSWLQKIAAEFNLSETAFLWRQPTNNPKQNKWDIRYYTPDGTEIDLCGHATLASACVLFHIHKKNPVPMNEVVFRNNQDILLPAFSSSSTTSSNSSTQIHMNFPWKNSISLSSNQNETIQMLETSLQLKNPSTDILFLGSGDDGEDLFVELTTEAFQSLPATNDISYNEMQSYEGPPRGIIVSCEAPSNEKMAVNFYSRFFGPKVGIKEDPVTGSAHCVLGPYFGKKLGKELVVGLQQSKRGGIVQCHLHPDEKKVEIVGNALLVMTGNLCV